MIGTTISHYKILEKLGGGGMGVVYKAEDTRLRRLVALKFLSAEFTQDEEAKQRFIHEAQAASALQHDNICTIHDIDETDDHRLFICMDYYNGETLKKKIERGPLPIGEAVGLVVQIASALARVYEAGVVHRDIKPANIMVTETGEAKIVDFGLAKFAGQASMTKSNSTVGTGAYMSPEQVTGSEVDGRSDLFSLGVLFYEALTGRRPFVGEHEAAVLYSVVNIDPPTPRSLRADIPPEVEAIIDRMLKKDTGDRYQSVSELLEDLQVLLDAFHPSRSNSVFHTVIRRISSSARIATAAIVIVVLLIAGSVVVYQWSSEHNLPKPLSIAVLPFNVIGADSVRTSQCDGLYEIIASKMVQFRSKRRDLTVVATSNSRTYKNGSDAYHRSGATSALNCSFQFAPGSAQVTVNLEDTKNAFIIGSDIIRTETGSPSELENKIVQSIGNILGIEVTSSDLQNLAQGGTKSMQANDLYVEARGHLSKYANSARLAAAIVAFEKALALDPRFALAHAGLGEACWRKYETTKDRRWIDSAMASCTRAVQLNDRIAPVHLALGIVYRGSGNDSAAVQEFERVLAIDSLNADAYREIAETYLRANKIELAEATYKRSIALRPEDWMAYNVLGRFYYRRGRLEEATGMWKKVVELAPDVRAGVSNLGGVYFAQERWQDAIAMFKRSIEIDSNNYQAYANLGTAYYYVGMYERSIESYERARKLNPSDYNVWGGLGAAYQELGSKKLAREAYETAATLAEEDRKVDPKNTRTLYQLAGYYADLGRQNESREVLRTLLMLAPDDADALGHAALVYELLGERSQALKLLKKAIHLGHTATEIKYSPEMKSLREDPKYDALIKTTH